MNFYKHYIGDFQRDTGHLSLTQRGAYRALMDHYYATEKPLPNDHAALCRIAGALNKHERDAVRVAMGFFEACDSGLMHTRIEVELHKAGEVSTTNRDIALAREAKRRAARTEHEQSTKRAPSVPRTDHEQSTNQTPDTKKDLSKPTASHPPAGGLATGFDDFWLAWPKGERKQDKAKCLEHWKRNQLGRVAAVIQADVRVKRGTVKWTEGFVEAPLVYLRGKRWEDGVTPDAAPVSDAAERTAAYLAEQSEDRAPLPEAVRAKLQTVRVGTLVQSLAPREAA